MTCVSFKHPPLVEVAYSLQFGHLDGFHMGLLGLFWGKVRERYPHVQHHARINAEIEKFGAFSAQKPGFKILEQAEVPRLMMLSKDQEQILQIQSDRLGYNWRKINELQNEYPRFENLKKTFLNEINTFDSFLIEQKLGRPNLTQIEIVNVNHIPAKGKSLNEVFVGLDCGEGLSSDLDREGYQFNIRHLIKGASGKPIGRLHSTVEKAVTPVGEELFVLRYIARSHIQGELDKQSSNLSDALVRLRNYINGAFVEMTTKSMQEEWGINDQKL